VSKLKEVHVKRKDSFAWIVEFECPCCHVINRRDVDEKERVMNCIICNYRFKLIMDKEYVSPNEEEEEE